MSFRVKQQVSAAWSRPELLLYALVPALVVLGIAFRILGLGFISFDMHDFLIGWYDRLAAGGFAALREPFYNYTPPYMYLLTLAAAQHWLPAVAAIKLISITFDLLNSFLVYRILRLRYEQRIVPLLGASAFLVLPTVLLNSAYWGQADAVYTFFLLACLYFLMQDRPLPAMLFLGLSFSLKAQAVFLAPLILLLLLRRRIPWIYLGLVPLVYVLMMLPAALVGRPLVELLTVYFSQAGMYGGLSMHAPNLYVFVPGNFYRPGVFAGVILTAVSVLAWIWIYAPRKLQPRSRILLYALASVGMIPFLLPKMHDRYFYSADVLSFLMALTYPRLWFLAVGYQFVSGLAYSIFLIPSLAPMPRGLAQAILYAAALLNTVLTALLLWNQWRIARADEQDT